MIINPSVYANLTELTKSFAAGSPKHVVIDNFFSQDIADGMHQHFPSVDSLKVKRNSMNENKVEDYHFERWDPVFLKARNHIRTDAFCQWLSTLTGIDGLSTPDNGLGSGIHQGSQGSYVDVHIDVNYDPASKLWRRINLLVYLNPHWQEEWGGDLELWDPAMTDILHKVAPLHNRAIIFLTDDQSPHGYKAIDVPEGESRKSFYAYYFTQIGEGFAYSDSKFVSRPDDPWLRKQATRSKEFVKIHLKRLLEKMGIKSLDFQDKNRF